MDAVFRLTGDAIVPPPGARVIRAADYCRLIEIGRASCRERVFRAV